MQLSSKSKWRFGLPCISEFTSSSFVLSSFSLRRQAELRVDSWNRVFVDEEFFEFFSVGWVSLDAKIEQEESEESLWHRLTTILVQSHVLADNYAASRTFLVQLNDVLSE